MGGRQRSKRFRQRRKVRAAVRPSRKAMGKLGNARGQETERRAVNAMATRRDAWPPWLVGVRRATEEEDQRGVDLVAQSDVGDIGIQVKSSHRGAARHSRRHVPVVVVGVKLGAAYRSLLAAITARRSELLAKRG